MISLILILKKRPEYFFEILNNNYQIADIKFFMKKLMTLLFFTSQLGISQEWPQWGADIDGEGLVDQSGWSVSTNELGNIVAIGAVGNDDAGTNTGYTRIFENVDGTWSQIGDDINGEGSGDQCGYRVSLNFEGNILAIGSNYNSGIGLLAGNVRLYENLAPEDCEEIISITADDVDDLGYDKYTGHGRLNAEKAVNFITSPSCQLRHFGTDYNPHTKSVVLEETMTEVWLKITLMKMV